MDCPICQTDLAVPAFEACTEDREAGPDVFRLRCGHAFHDGCLCRALRLSSGCPVCRMASDSAEPAEGLRLEIGPDGQMQLIIGDDEDVQAPLQDLARTANAVALLENLGQSPQVQQERERLNRVRRRYRALEATIMQERRRRINEALRTLRHDFKREFEAEARALRRAIAALRRADRNAIERSMPAAEAAEALNLIHEMTPNAYTLHGTVGNEDTFGPLKHRFWHH